MDAEKKKQLKKQYDQRMPDKGVISLHCMVTGESFLGPSNDFRADYNSQWARLNFGSHPNKQLQELWNQHGEESFEITLLERLEYEDPQTDYQEELEALRDLCLERDSQAQRIWK